MKRLGREIGRAAAVLLGILSLTFVLFHWVGGDPAGRVLGAHARPELLQQLRQAYGLSRPLWAQYVDFLWSMVCFDFGRSFAGGQPVAALLLSALPRTLALTVPAFLLGSAGGLFCAALPLLCRRPGLARLFDLASAAAMSLPLLMLIIAAQYGLAYRLGLFPISGGYGLPILLLAALQLGYDYRYYRGALARHASGDYLVAAVARGLPRWRVVLRHWLANGAPSIAVRLVTAAPFLFTGSLLLENYFGLRGLGAVLVEALWAVDWPVLRAATWLVSLLFVLLHGGGDLLCRWLDPRGKPEEAEVRRG